MTLVDAPPKIRSARLVLWPGRALYLGPLLANDAHSHHAIQVTIALEGELRVSHQFGDRMRRATMLVTPADELHSISTAHTTAQLYLDPDSVDGRAITAKVLSDGRQVFGPGAPDIAPSRRLWADGGSATQWQIEMDRLCAAVAARTPAPVLDSRVQAVLALAQHTPARTMTIATAAAAAGLSASRVAHLFVAHTGVPFRRYLLWLRLIDAITELPTSRSLTTAAHRAGFADSAHFTRTFRRMFGMPPSALLTHPIIIEALAGGLFPTAKAADGPTALDRGIGFTE